MAADLAFWRDEVERGSRAIEPHHPGWQKNLDYYTGGIPADEAPAPEFVNVNVDFYETEQKVPQLFFEMPELQLGPAPGFEATAPGVYAFRLLINALLGPDCINAIPTVLAAIKDCVANAGRGATVIGYQPTIQPVTTTPMPGAVLGLSQSVPVPVHEDWFFRRIPAKKFLCPADFTETEFDRSPWLAMRFRLPLNAARQICDLPPDFEGTQTRDEHLQETGPRTDEATSMAYVEGTLVWYQAWLFDDDEIHPQIYRRHVLIDGLDRFADKDDPAWRSPYQTKLPNGRLRADSLIGNPIDVLTLRDVPDSAIVPSDGAMRRGLVKEYCLFRTQMVQERDINKPKFAYSATKFPPEAIPKLTEAMTGSLVPLPDECFQGDKIVGFAQVAQGSSPRQTYLANDYIAQDIAKTSGIDATGAGVAEDGEETATKTAEIAKARNVRLDAERKRVLRWYLRVIDKIAALALRYCNDPQRVAELIGPQQADVYLAWRSAMLEAGDPRPKFTAKADSQLKLDAAQERRSWLNFYNFAAKDPLMNRGAILRKLVTLYGEDPAQYVADAQPEQKPDPSLGYSFKGEDLNPLSPQFPIVLEILAQSGVTISPDAVQQAQTGAMTQAMAMAGGMMVPTGGSAKPGASKPAGHGGLADKMGPLSKQDSEQTGNRPGPQVQ